MKAAFGVDLENWGLGGSVRGFMFDSLLLGFRDRRTAATRVIWRNELSDGKSEVVYIRPTAVC
jgi:hypothetical protein